MGTGEPPLSHVVGLYRWRAVAALRRLGGGNVVQPFLADQHCDRRRFAAGLLDAEPAQYWAGVTALAQQLPMQQNVLARLMEPLSAPEKLAAANDKAVKASQTYRSTVNAAHDSAAAAKRKLAVPPKLTALTSPPKVRDGA